VEVLLLLLALELLEPRAERLKVARDLFDQRGAVDVERLGPLAGGKLTGEAAHLAQRKDVAAAHEAPDRADLERLEREQQGDQRVAPEFHAMANLRETSRMDMTKS